MNAKKEYNFMQITEDARQLSRNFKILERYLVILETFISEINKFYPSSFSKTLQTFNKFKPVRFPIFSKVTSKFLARATVGTSLYVWLQQSVS